MPFIWGSVVVSLSFFIKGVSGFANTLVFNGLLGFTTDAKILTPVDLILSFPANFLIAWRGRRHVQARVVLPLIITLAIGIVPGALFLRSGNDRILKLILGAAIIALAVILYLQDRHPRRSASNPLLLYAIGIASGMLCGLFGVGAFLVAYIKRTTEGGEQLRANLCCVFLAENLIRLPMYALTGILRADILVTAAALLPAMAIGLACGMLAARRLPGKAVNMAVYGLLLIMGAGMIAGHL